MCVTHDDTIVRFFKSDKNNRYRCYALVFPISIVEDIVYLKKLFPNRSMTIFLVNAGDSLLIRIPPGFTHFTLTIQTTNFPLVFIGCTYKTQRWEFNELNLHESSPTCYHDSSFERVTFITCFHIIRHWTSASGMVAG